VKILEFERGDHEKTVKLPIAETGLVTFSVVSELACVPAELDLGVDERELALLASFAVVADLADVDAGSAAREVRPWVQSTLPAVGQLPQPVFVVGMYRSGTS